jgi:hypothetical protein
LKSSDASTASSPRPIRISTPTSDSAMPPAWRKPTGSRNSSQATTMMMIGSVEFSTAALMAMVYCSARKSIALPPRISIAPRPNMIFQWRRMISALAWSRPATNGSRIRKASPVRQNDRPMGGTSSRT